MVTENGQSDGNTSFLRAARNGQLDKVLEYLKSNIDINTSNTNGLNALHLASKDGHVDIVEELLKRGAVVDAATKKGNTALHIASLAGQEEVVKLLVQNGASVNVQSQNGFTPLYMAAQENHDNVVKFLLSNGANQSLSTEDGFTPLAVAMQQGHDKVVAVLLENDTRGKVRLPALHIAAKKDDVKAAKLLLENDHNADVTSKSGFTPLHIASHYGNQQIANLLIQKSADVNYAAKHNITPLHVAAKWGKTNMVSLLLENGATIEAKTRDGLTPLHCAARSGHEQVVDMLLERGAPISSKTKNGLAPLHMAAQGDHVDAARILLYHRAPVDEVTVDYLTALHVAAHCGHVRVAKLLLDRQADANARALNGFTPLHIACKKNRIKVVELLLKHGANISATTESGLTPLHVASFMGCMNIVIYLLQHDANPDVPTVRGETPLHLAARANQTDIIRILLRNGAQVDVRAREQQTPLHIASRLGNADIVALLLQHGAKVDNTTKDMYTSLHIAAKEGQDEVASLLWDNGASLHAVTKKGFTPLHLAAKYGHLKVVKFLLKKEAPVDAQGKNGVTPLHVALHYDHQDVASVLLDKGASPHSVAKNGHTPLHIAARKNQMDIANTLLEYGANPNAESKAGFTPLHLSAQEGHNDMAALLLEHKANVNQEAKNGLTPLHLCAQEDRVPVAEVLVKNGVDVNAATKTGYSPLHIACHYGQINMVRFLLQNGARIESTTSLNYTPLHQAAQQGHANIVNILLDNRADPDATTTTGQTPIMIAQKLGYITVIENLKLVSNKESSPKLNSITTDEKYRVQAPELMHETFMSDSEEEGGEDIILGDHQTYRYLTADEMKSLGDDSLPIDVTRDERIDSNRMISSMDNNSFPPQHIEDSISPEHITQNYVEYITKCVPDNTEIDRYPVNIGFLVSFLVDARGGAMRGCRHSGVRVIVPPRCAPSPTRITCRYVRPQRTPHPPPLMEGEALASRVLELGPVGAKFLGPVIIEVPHFAALRDKEREIVILRSDNGENWKEHTVEATEDMLNEVLQKNFEADDLNELEDISSGRITRIVTQDFPQYFAVVSRIRQEVHAIGPEGGMVSSTVVPQVQAVFPEGALTKKIKVGLQAQPIDPELTAKLLGHGVAVSPVVTVEPRRRKFHKAITLTMPAPKAHSQGMINQYSGSAPTLRLLCSITGGTTRAQWEDVTGSTPLTFVNDCVSFTTTVSARFWLMDCRNISDATKMATELYKEAIHVPFMAKFVVFAKRVDPLEARLRVFCMTDDKEEKTLEHQEHFTEVAKSRDVEVLEGKQHFVEFAGNLVPVTKSGEQLSFCFRAFKENRLPFTVRVKDQHAEAVSRCLFMKEPKVPKGEQPQQPICILNIVLPDDIVTDTVSLTDSDSYKKYTILSDYHRPDPRIADMSNLLGDDWVPLANQLGLTTSEINVIKSEYPESTAKQAQSMLRMWLSQSGSKAQMNTLENALRRIGREDIITHCINVDHSVITRISQEYTEPYREKKDRFEKEIIAKKHVTPKMAKEEEDDEKKSKTRDKYSAEEKEQPEEEEDEEEEEEECFDKAVSERRQKIEKRLSAERAIPASSQRREIVQEITSIKQQNLVEDKLAEVQQKVLEHEEKSKTVLTKTVTTPKQDNKTSSKEEKKSPTPTKETMKALAEEAHKTVEEKFMKGVTQRLEQKTTISLSTTYEAQKSPKLSKTPPPSPADFLFREQAHASQEFSKQQENMSVTNSDIPQIAITHDEVENEDSGYLPINEVLTDTEDLIEDDKVSCSNKKCSKLKIVFNTDTYTTDVEDIDFSDDNQEDEELVSHPKPIDIEEIDLEQGTIEESYKNNVKLRGGKNIKTVQKNGTVPANYKIYDNYTDEELFDTDNEMQSNDAPNNNFNANSFDSGFTKISDNNTLRAHASSTTGYLSAQSLSPNLSDLTDVEIIESGSEEEVNKKKSKSKRKKRNHTRAVTDTEDLEFSDNESTKKTHNRKSHHKSKSIPKSISLNFESSKEDEEPLFPVCKKIAEKRPYILNIPEFDMQTNTDTEDFASIIDIGSPQEEINDLELDDKVEQITDCCSQITESQSSTGKNIEHLKENQVIKTSELEVESDESESENNKTCNTDTYSERVEHLNISTEAEDCYDDNELKQLPEIELPSVVRNITVFSEKNGVPTISVLPLEDSSCEEDEINDRVTDEESISDIEETSTSVQHSPLVEIPDMDWGVISVKEESHDQDYKNINEIDVSIIKRKRPPKFKYLYEKQNKLTVKQENIGNITDTEDLAIDDKKAKEFNYVLCDKPSEEKITNGTETSDTEGAVTSTDDDLYSHSRTETPTVNLLQKEFDRISISEVNVKNTSKPLSEGVMYLKGGGYYLKVTDVEDLSEDDIGVNAEKSSQSVGSEFCEKEWESQKDELQVDKLDGTVDKKVDVPSVSSTQKNEVSISSHSITSPLVTPQTSYAQIDTMLEKIFGEIDQLSPDEDPFDHQNSENKDQCKSSLELQPSVDVTIEVPIKKCIKVPKKYTTSKELCIDENQINSATETDVAVKTVPVETKQDDIKNYNLKLDLEKAFSFSPTEEFDNEGSQEYIKNDKDVIEDFPITENIADSKLIELAREITQFIDQERFNTMSNSTKTYTDAVPLDCNIITDDMKDSCFKSGLDPTFAPKATEEIMSDENSKSHIEDNLLKSTDELRNQNEDVPHYVDREPLQGLFVESFKPKDRKKNVFRITLETAFVSNINNTNIDKHETERISKPLMKDKKTNSEKLHYSTESINLRTPSYLPTCTSSVEKNDLGDELLSKYLKELDESVNKIDDTLKNEHEHNDKSNNVINIVQVNGKSLINPDKIASQEQHIPEDFKYKVDNMTDNLIDFNDVIYLEDDEFQKSQGRVQVTDLDQISEPDMSDVIDTFENVPENSNIWWEGTYRDIESPIVDKTETILDVSQRHFQESNVFIPYIKNIISIPSSSADPLVIQAISSSSDDENSLLQSHKIFSDKSKNAKADVKVLVTSLDRDIEIKSVKDLKTNIGASRKFKKRSKTLPGRSSDLLSRCKNNLLDNKRYLSEPLLLKAFAETNADSYQPSFTLQTLFEINSTSNSTGGNDSQKSFKLLPVSNLSFPLEFDVNSNRQEQWPEQCNSDCKRDDNRANEFSLLVSTQHFHEKSELLDAYCDWLLQQSEETCNVHLTEALLTTQPMPLPKPRSKMLDTDFPSNETEVVPTKPKSPVRDDLLDEDEVPESYLDKKKFWENVTQEHSHKRYSLQDTGLSEKESFKKKQLSMQDFTSSPVPKPRTLHSSQSLVESTSSITQERSEGTSSKTSDEDISIQERRQKQNILSFDLKLQKKSQDKKKKVSTDELAQKGSGQNSENLGYISDSEDVEHYISDSEIEDRVPQIRDRMMSVFVPSASSTACRSIYERSASLPTEDLYEVSARTIKARKEYYEEQIRKEMIEEQLTSELEEEPSPERKNLLLSSTEEDHTEADAKSIGEDVEDIREEHAYDTKKKTETKSIDHKVITEERISTSSSKVTEHIPQSEYIEEMSFIQKSKLNEPRNGISKITHDDFQFKVDKDNEHKLFETQHSISSDKSGDHIDEQNFRDDSHSTKPDSMEVLVDKSELEDSEKLADLDQDIEGKSIESLDIDESPKQTFVDTELKNGHFDREDTREKFTDECQRDVNIKLPQENIQNVVWEVSVESASKNAFSEQADDLHVQEVVRVTEKFSEVKSVSKIPILKKNEPSKSVVKDDVVIEKKDIEKQSKIPKPETEIKLPKTGDVKLLDETAKFIELESRYNPDSPTELQKSSKEQSKTSKYSDVEFESSHILPARKKDLVTKVDETAKFDKSKIKDDIQTFIESETKHTTDYTRISELQKLEPNKNKDTQNTVTDSRLKKDIETFIDIDKRSKSKADVEVADYLKQEKLTETAKNKEEIVSDFDKVKVKKSTRDFLENETKHITDYTSQSQKLDKIANIQQQTEVSTLSKVASAKEPNRTEEHGYNFDQAKLKTDTEQFLGSESKHVTDYTKVIQSSDYVVTKTDQTLKDTGAERKSEDDKKEKISDRIDPIKFKTETENFLEFESRHNTDRVYTVKENSQFVKEYDSQLLIKKDVVNLEKENEEMSEKNIKKSVISGETKAESSSKALETATMTEKYADKILKEKTNAKTVETKIDTQKFIELESQYNTDFNSHTIKKDSSISKPVHSLATGMVEKELGKSQGTKIDKKETKDQEKTDEMRLTESNRIKIAEDVASFIESESNYNTDYEQITKPRKDPKNTVKIVIDDVKSETSKKLDKLAAESKKTESETEKKSKLKTDTQGQSEIEKLIFDCLQQQKVHPDEALKIANALVEEIEAEIQKHDSLGTEPIEKLEEKTNIPEFLRHLAETKGLDQREVELVESVLARKRRGFDKLSRGDTQASSVEITDEDLKYSGTDLEYSQVLEQQIDQLEAEKVSNLDSESFEEPSDNSQSKTTFIEKTGEEHSEDTEWSHDFGSNEDTNILAMKKGGFMKTHENIVSEKVKIVDDKVCSDDDKSVSEKISEESEISKTKIETVIAEDSHILLKDLEIKASQTGTAEVQADHISNVTYDKIKIIDKDKPEEITLEQTQVASDDKVSAIYNAESHQTEMSKDKIKQINKKTEEKYDELNKEQEKVLKKESISIKVADDGSQIKTKEDIDKTFSVKSSTTITQTHQREETSSTTLTEDTEAKEIFGDELLKELESGEVKTIVETHEVVRRTSSNELKDVGYSKKDDSDSPSVVLRKSKSDTSSSSPKMKPDRKSGYDYEINSSSGESHYQSFEMDSNKSRPCSSDVEGLIAAGSSEYESALTSQIYSAKSQISTDYKTVSSMSSKDSMKSLDSESSGNLASVEVSEHSETLVPSTSDLDDILDSVDHQLLADESELNEQNLVWSNRSMDTHHLNEVSDSEGLSFAGVDESMEASEEESPELKTTEVQSKMKRSCEMTFQPEPKILAPESPHADSEDKIGTSLDDGSIFSTSMSSTSSTGAQRTVIEQSRADSDRLEGSMNVSSEHLSLEDVDSIPRGSIDSVIIPSNLTSNGSPTALPAGITEAFTDEMLVLDDGNQMILGKQSTEESTTSVTSATAPEQKKKGHKRTESTVLVGTLTRFSTEQYENEKKSGSQLSSKEISFEDKQDIDEREKCDTRTSSQVSSLDKESDTGAELLNGSKAQPQTSISDSGHPIFVSDDKHKNELTNADKSTDLTEESSIPTSSPDPLAKFKFDDFPTPKTVKEFEHKDRDHFDRKGEIHHEKKNVEEGEAEAVFSMVPPISPAHKIKEIQPILEDDVAEKHELESQERIKKDTVVVTTAILKDASPVPDIKITQHMAPLVDNNFHYPELELESKERQQEQQQETLTDTPQTPASNSSKSSEETDQGREYVLNESVSTIQEEPEGTVDEPKKGTKQKQTFKEKKGTDSPDSSDSFEMLEKPDLIDDFVVIEEVGKEAHELDTEGKSVKIAKVPKPAKKHDEEVEQYLAHSAPTPLTRMTDIKYYPDGSSTEGAPFDFEESPPQVAQEKSKKESDSQYDKELEANKKWVEQQFQGDHATMIAAGYGYEMDFERGPLEDIKEEDITDFAASSYGSQKDSGGSVKESYSSTPEYDVLAGRKYFTRSGEHDDTSMSSLQEFENLEQAMSLEMRRLHQGSQDSSSNGSFKTRYIVSKSGQGDDISVSSLKEFEGLEKACIAAHKIEIKVKEEEALLAQIEEGQESIASESESCETISGTEKKAVTDTDEEDYEKRMFEIDEIIKQAQSNVERFVDLKDVEKTESLGRGDSVEEVSKVPDLDLDTPVVKSTIKVQWKENEDVMMTSTDSLEQQIGQTSRHDSADSLDQETAGNIMTTSTDSLEAHLKKSSKDNVVSDSMEGHGTDKNYIVSSDSLDLAAAVQHTDTNVLMTDSMDEDSSKFGPYDHSTSSTGKDLNSSTKDDFSQDKDDEHQADNLDISSSAATHATYQYETDSVFSGSFTSGGSNTMVSSTNSLDQARQGTSVDLAGAVRQVWFDEDDTGDKTITEFADESSKPYVTEIIEPSSDDYYSHVIHRKVELPPEVRKITFTGADADEQMKKFLEEFKEGEECEETEEIDSDGNIHIRKVLTRRIVVKDDGGQQAGPEIEEYFRQLNQPEVMKGKGIIGSNISEDKEGKQEFAASSSKSITKHSRDMPEMSTSSEQPTTSSVKASRRRPLRCEISIEDQTEVDPREHDWRFNLPKHAEGEEGSDKEEIDKKTDQQ